MYKPVLMIPIRINSGVRYKLFEDLLISIITKYVNIIEIKRKTPKVKQSHICVLKFFIIVIKFNDSWFVLPGQVIN